MRAPTSASLIAMLVAAQPAGSPSRNRQVGQVLTSAKTFAHAGGHSMILQGPYLSQQTSERVPRNGSASDAANLSRLAERTLEVAAQRNASIVTAESCTAGKLAAVLSEAPGAAEHLHGSFVTYTKANKTKSLGVSADLLQRKGAVCREVAVAMAEGALVRSPATLGFDHWGRRTRSRRRRKSRGTCLHRHRSDRRGHRSSRTALRRPGTGGGAGARHGRCARRTYSCCRNGWRSGCRAN